MINASETFDGTFPFTPHFNTAAGFKMHYIDEGTSSNEVILCLHGEPTWSYLFRNIVNSLRTSHRVIAIDHMGFGKSETPKERTYWLQDHIDNLEKFVLDLNLKDITLLMHDFGGPVGMGLAARHPDLVKRIISVNGPTPLGQSDLFTRLTKNATKSPWFQWIINAHSNGTLIPILEQLHYNTLSTLKLNGFEDNSIITKTWLNAYSSPFETPAECAGAIGWALGFATGKHQFETPSEIAKSKLSQKPAFAIWGFEDKTLHSDEFLPLFREAFPEGLIHTLKEVGHYSPEDAHAEISSQILNFLKET